MFQKYVRCNEKLRPKIDKYPLLRKSAMITEARLNETIKLREKELK